MTTVELRTSIAAELDQMSAEMLESVSRYVSRLSRRARIVRRGTSIHTEPERTQITTMAKSEQFTPKVMQFKRGNPWYATDEEVNRLLQEHMKKKFQ